MTSVTASHLNDPGVSMPTSPPVVPSPGPPVTQADWYPDPWSPEAHIRYWDGAQWTPYYAVAPPKPKVRQPVPTLGLGAAFMMIAVIAASAVGLRLTTAPLADAIGPTPTIALSYTCLFGLMAVAAVWASKRWGTGDLRHDLGLRIRPLDILWFPFGALILWILQVLVIIVLFSADVPFRSNTDALDGIQDSPGAFAVLSLAAVVGAPIFEELAFRGVIQRSFASTMPVWGAITITSMVFGVYHFIPEFGIENAGLVIALAIIGGALGTIAHLSGRLAPAMLAHAGLNAVTLTILWLASSVSTV